MRLDLMQHLRMDQRMKLAPRMIQSMEILQLPIMALQDRIQQELQENPLLEVEEELGDAETAAPDSDLEAPASEPESTQNNQTDELLQWLNDDWTDGFGSGHKSSRSGSDDEGERKHDAMQNVASRPQSLQDYVLDQFSFFTCSETVRTFGVHVIENLDNDGYLAASLEELMTSFGGGITLAEAQEALELIQKLEPKGVGARDLRECLLLQLHPEQEHYELLFTLISDHLDDVEHNRLPTVERKTGLPLEMIKEALEHLGQLRIRPGALLAHDSAPQVIPDVIVEKDDQGKYQVRLLSDRVPTLRISRFYQQQLRGNTDRTTKEYIQRKLQAARWLIESIEQRQSTLLKVAQAIVDHQTMFLENGQQYIEPLKMQQIADRVGVHVTTVSRAVGDKWIQSPRGIFSLKRFFGGGTINADGETVAWDTIRQKLIDLIDREDKKKPYSDEQLARKLSEQGLEVARRTVTKYREKLGIPKKAQRKQY